MEKISILFMHMMMDSFQEKNLSDAFQKLNNLYEFEVTSCLELPTIEEVVSANIIVCPGIKFNKNFSKIKEIVKVNPSAWFVTVSHSAEGWDHTRENGAKYSFTQPKEGIIEVKKLNEFVIQKFIELSKNKMEMFGAGFLC